MAGPTLSYLNLARALKIVALLLFLLPWVTVSCSPEALGEAAGGPPMTGAPTTEIATATGLQMALGSVEYRNLPAPAAGEPAAPFTEPDLILIGGALLILLSLAATFLLRGTTRAMTAIGGLVLAACALGYTVLMRVPKSVQDHFATAGVSDGPGGPQIPTEELARMIQTKVEIGFWLTIAALAAAIVLLVLSIASHRPAAAAEPATPGL